MEYFKLISVCIVVIFIIYLLYDVIISKISQNNIPMYCIYIPSRETYIKNVFNNLGLQPNFIKGIDKNTIDVDKLIKENKIKYWNQVNTGRIACHYSHLSVLKQFLNTNKERCIIFEDDIKLKYSKYRTLKLLKKILYNTPKDCDILYLGFCYEDCNMIQKYNDYVSVAYEPKCRHAYVVNRNGAKKILDKTSIMYDNGDKMMMYLIKKNVLKTYISNYSLFLQNRESLGTNLGNNGIIRGHDCYNYM
jgi:GR25 family glycosyltransferase involved in LPS biosynthesis